MGHVSFVRLEKSFMEVSFMTRLPALSLTTFTVQLCSEADQFTEKAGQFTKVDGVATKVYCLRCPKNNDVQIEEAIVMDKISDGAVVISNANLELIFDEDTKLLTSIKDKKSGLVKKARGPYPVSYTHLTLPTIYSV